MERCRVLVSGAGPTGLLLAAELERRGVECLLIDELDAPRGWDRATVIHPRSMEIFEALGIAGQFLDEGVRVRSARLQADGEMLGELDLQLTGSRYGFDLGLSEETTERLLTNYLNSVGGSVTRSTRLVRFVQGPAGVSATLERGGANLDVEAEWLVGCDGLHSVVRQESGIEFSGNDVDASWAVFDTTIAGWDREFDVTAVLLDVPPVIMTPLPGQRWRVYIRPTSNESDLVAEASQVVRRYSPGATFIEITTPARFHCHSRLAGRYRSRRVLLAGDAAHVCSPAEGHGMNTGLQDAFNLGWKLALVCHGAGGEGLLDTYETERRPVAERIVASGADVETSEALTDPAARSARNAAMRQIFGDPKTSHHEAAAAAELDRSYAGSSIVMGESSAGVAPGRLLPDTSSVEHPATGSGPLHQLAHRRGHTVFVIGGTAADPSAVVDLVEELEATHRGATALEAVLGFSTRRHGGAVGWISEEVAELLGINGVTMLAIRPDRYVGLRDEGAEPQALASYLESLTS